MIQNHNAAYNTDVFLFCFLFLSRQINATDSGSLSRGHIPLGAIQVRKLPQGNGDPGILLKGDDLGVSKELLLLTSELNNNRKAEGIVGVTGSFDETLVRIQDFLVQSGLETATKTHEILKRRSSDSSQKTDRSPESDAPADSLSSESDALLEDDYEPNLQDKLADSDLYALLPPDLDSPNSLLSRSLADLTDQTLCEYRRWDDVLPPHCVIYILLLYILLYVCISYNIHTHSHTV